MFQTEMKNYFPVIWSQIKKGVTGSGTADKKQVKEAIKLILGLKELKGHDDSWDAVAAGFVGLAMFR